MPKFYPHPRDVVGLETVARVLSRAERTASNGLPFTVCICDTDGNKIAAAIINSFEAVKRFSREMARMRYAAEIVGDPYAGCDVMYRPSDAARDIFDDGSPLTEIPPV